MSREVVEGKKERVLRRSKRNRVSVVSESDSSTDTIESEAETVVGWNLGDVSVVDREKSESVDGSEYNFSEVSNVAYHNHSFEENTEILNPGIRDLIEKKQEVMSVEPSTGSVDSGLGKAPEAGLADFMRLYIDEQRRRDERRERERREENDRREEERREERELRDRERAEAREREERLWSTVHRTTATPETPKLVQVTLPRLKEGGEVETFVTAFETALGIAGIPREDWKTRLISSIPMEAIVRISSTIEVEDVDYDGLKSALRGSNEVSFCSAAEDWSTGEKGNVFKKDIRTACSRLVHLHRNVTRDADTAQGMSEATAVARAREHLVPELKAYIDMSQRFAYKDFVIACEEWVRSQPGDVSCFRQQRAHQQSSVRGQGNGYLQSSQSLNRQKPLCFSGPVLLGWRQ